MLSQLETREDRYPVFEAMETESLNQHQELEIHYEAKEVEREVTPESTHEISTLEPKNYWRSGDFAELIMCGLFFLLCLSTSFGEGSLRMRPIPFQRLENGLFVENLVNAEEYSGQETVSDLLLILLGIAMPIALQLGLSNFLGTRGDKHGTACVYLVAVGLTLATTEVLKLYVGYLRPIFYALCEPEPDYSACTSGSSSSARKSFPSGHASTSFCGLSLLTFYIHHRFGVPSHPVRIVQEAGGNITLAFACRPPRRARIVSIISLTPLALAGFISASRVVDNKHFPADVVGGALLGTTISLFSHSLWFPTWPPRYRT